jgi:hypothetical protein
MRLHRLALLAAAPVALAALLGTAPTASAGIKSNSVTSNGLSNNALSTTGAALDDLDGVQVEAVVLPAAE